jgi:hypothetical protein
MLNCESSEAKRTCSIVKKIISNQSEHVYIEEFKYRSEANMFILKNLNIEAKRTCSLVRKFISKRSELVFIKEFKYRSEAKQVKMKQ